MHNIEKITIERESYYMNCETGELYDSHDEAVTAYSAGIDIQVTYRWRFDGDEWQPWQDGPRWEH